MQENLIELKKGIVEEVKRRIIEESISKILKCVDLLTEEELNYRPNENCNSIGNLIVHLNGNVRQWILSAAGGKQDIRNRNSEFDQSRRYNKPVLKDILKKLADDLEETLPYLIQKNYLKIKKVQCYEENTISILIHAIEHFSYHTGQIAYITKFLKNSDLEFYADDSLNSNN
jgi:uncharacterized damage-inducible protein DinB